MANETIITVVGNLTADPELRQAGQHSVVNFTIASTPRRFDRQKDDWVDEETLFLRAQAWRDHAENIASRLQKGTRVIATGYLKQRSYETKEGEKRTTIELDVLDIGTVVPKQKANAQRAGQPRQTAPAQQDEWNQPQAEQSFYSDETPF